MASDKSKCNYLAEEPPRFFWVDYEEGKSQKQAVARSKHAFLKSKQYQSKQHQSSRRDKKLQNAKSSSSSSSAQGSREHSLSGGEARDDPGKNDTAEGKTTFSELILTRSPTVRVLDAYPSLLPQTCMADNPDAYFHHYRLHTSKSTWPFSFRDMSQWFWQKAYEEPALGQVILSTSAAQLAMRLKLNSASPSAIHNATKDTLQFRSQTIKSLQTMLGSTSPSTSEAAILVVAHLCCVEAAEANLVAVEAHIQGLKKLVDMLGGLDMLGNETISTVYCCEVMRGVLGFPAVFPIATRWAARVLSQNAFLTAENNPSSLGTRFFNSPWSRNIHPYLKWNLQSLQKLIIYYEHKLRNDSATESISNDWFILLVLRLYHPVHNGSHVAFQESLRLSAIVYCMIRLWTFRGLPCLAYLVNNLRQSLDQSFSDLESASPDLLFWVLFMGGLASHKAFDCHMWFVERLADVTEDLYLVSWDSAVDLLKGYFFLPRSDDTDAKALWQSVVRKRIERGQIELSFY